MSYVDGFLAAVPAAKREAYVAFATRAAAIFKEHGALKLVENWGDDVPEGKLTSFPMAVKLEEGEVVVFSWVIWPSKEARVKGWEAIMQDPRMQEAGEMPFDGKRMIYGGFETVLEA
ncbi:DUF1428 domain-containing protein [Cereibacter changlensis]|jgi:uncharacterized protein YbaA (DUF1428 family)|uniref:DUF1428 domain-containing protein n=1 Tax=Cereibacter changlensis TaxID=402884 RepID=A0A4V6WLQ2_9RHOB|nr:DUF1428 domain-containing protein [Cereibacter changlensis]MBZ4690800.1 signal recognition particle [Cereibacter sp.]TKA96047.1 DUF1428 domain-containing protein [Cereibacter changlensis]